MITFAFGLAFKPGFTVLEPTEPITTFTKQRQQCKGVHSIVYRKQNWPAFEDQAKLQMLQKPKLDWNGYIITK
jgi:hypothetical protein